MGAVRIPNADLSKTCAKCGTAYPRMYLDGTTVICRIGRFRKPRGAQK